MNSNLRVTLNCSLDQAARLRELQQAFARACNTLAPVVRDTRCWNRVALHHMTYRMLRERFPQLGSQMACNAIYSVSRACRAVYQGPRSPFNLARMASGAPPALLLFSPASPVYFDRHTLSLKNGRLSMFTLDGRMRFELGLAEADERRFHEEKLTEVILSSRLEEFTLTFAFGANDSQDAAVLTVNDDDDAPLIPDFLQVLPDVQAFATGVSP